MYNALSEIADQLLRWSFVIISSRLVFHVVASVKWTPRYFTDEGGFIFFSAYSKVKFFIFLLESISKDNYFCFVTI